MRMRLFASLNARFRIVNGKTPCMPFASFLTYKILHQFKALFRCQFTGQRYLQFPISRTVCTFKLVSRLPEMGGIISRPFRHVSVCGIFQILTVAVFLFALDVIGMVCSLSLATKLNAEVIGRHGFSPPQERTVSRRRRETYKCASF
ncbi:Uncharacterised protein [Escherichia coli]|nr:Uncharacterised protein [Escherichia coli]SRZ64914.1 Uncharacterised protein [Escherichia coli]VVZ22352.1 Uncharacterised protein [Escherichia coli]